MSSFRNLLRRAWKTKQVRPSEGEHDLSQVFPSSTPGTLERCSFAWDDDNDDEVVSPKTTPTDVVDDDSSNEEEGAFVVRRSQRTHTEMSSASSNGAGPAMCMTESQISTSSRAARVARGAKSAMSTVVKYAMHESSSTQLRRLVDQREEEFLGLFMGTQAPTQEDLAAAGFAVCNRRDDRRATTGSGRGAQGAEVGRVRSGGRLPSGAQGSFHSAPEARHPTLDEMHPSLDDMPAWSHSFPPNSTTPGGFLLPFNRRSTRGDSRGAEVRRTPSRQSVTDDRTTSHESLTNTGFDGGAVRVSLGGRSSHGSEARHTSSRQAAGDDRTLSTDSLFATGFNATKTNSVGCRSNHSSEVRRTTAAEDRAMSFESLAATAFNNNSMRERISFGSEAQRLTPSRQQQLQQQLLFDAANSPEEMAAANSMRDRVSFGSEAQRLTPRRYHQQMQQQQQYFYDASNSPEEMAAAVASSMGSPRGGWKSQSSEAQRLTPSRYQQMQQPQYFYDASSSPEELAAAALSVASSMGSPHGGWKSPNSEVSFSRPSLPSGTLAEQAEAWAALATMAASAAAEAAAAAAVSGEATPTRQNRQRPRHRVPSQPSPMEG